MASNRQWCQIRKLVDTNFGKECRFVFHEMQPFPSDVKTVHIIKDRKHLLDIKVIVPIDRRKSIGSFMLCDEIEKPCNCWNMRHTDGWRGNHV